MHNIIQYNVQELSILIKKYYEKHKQAKDANVIITTGINKVGSGLDAYDVAAVFAKVSYKKMINGNSEAKEEDLILADMIRIVRIVLSDYGYNINSITPVVGVNENLVPTAIGEQIVKKPYFT